MQGEGSGWPPIGARISNPQNARADCVPRNVCAVALLWKTCSNNPQPGAVPRDVFRVALTWKTCGGCSGVV